MIDSVLLGHPITRTLIEVILVFVTLFLSSCQIYRGELLEDGKYVESGFRIGSLSIASERERVLSPSEFEEKLKREAEEQKLKDEMEANRRERLYKIESKEKRRKVLLYMSVISYCLALAAVVAGVLIRGYKTFGILCGVLMLLGTAFLSMVTTIHVLSWFLLAAVIVGVLRLLYVFRNRGVEV